MAQTAPAARSVRARLGSLLNARSIALVGATRRSPWSSVAFRNCVDLGFRGRIHVVNPKGGLIHGQTAARSCAAIGEHVDAALLMVPSSAIPDALGDLHEAGIRNAVILSSGSPMTGATVRDGEEQLTALARDCDITLLGPNCLGFVNYLDRVPIWSAALATAAPGNVAIVAQDGVIASRAGDFSQQQGVGLGYVVSTGSEAGVTAARVLEFLVDDARIRVVILFVNGIRDAAVVESVAARVLARDKAVIVLKTGVDRMVAAGPRMQAETPIDDDSLFSAACTRHGLIRVRSIEEAVVTADLLARTKPPRRPGLGMVALSSGICTLAVDRAGAVGAPLCTFSGETSSALAALVPQSAAAGNPFDVTTAAVVEPALLERVVMVVDGDPGVGLVSVVFDPPEERGGLAYDAMKRLGVAAARTGTGLVLMSTTLRPVSDARRNIADEVGVTYLGCGLEHGLSAIAHAFRHAPRLGRAPRRHRQPSRVSIGGAPASGSELRDALRRAGVPVALERRDGRVPTAARRSSIEVLVHVLRDANWGPALAVWAGAGGTTMRIGPGVRLLPLSTADAAGLLAELCRVDGAERRNVAAELADDRLIDVIVRIGDIALRIDSSLATIRVRLRCTSGGRIELLDALLE